MTLGVSFHEAAQREFDEATDFSAMERTSLGAAFPLPVVILTV